MMNDRTIPPAEPDFESLLDLYYSSRSKPPERPMIDDDDLEMLATYLEGNLTPAEEQHFRTRLEQEEALRNAAADLVASVRGTEFGEQIMPARTENIVPLFRPAYKRLAAAAVLVIGVGSLFYFAGNRATRVVETGPGNVAQQPTPEVVPTNTQKAPIDNLLGGLRPLSELAEPLTSKVDASILAKELGQKGSPAMVFHSRIGEFRAQPQRQTAGASQGGAGRAIYELTAPSAVYLWGPSGSATGFIVEKGGWILTNYSVAVQGSLDKERRVRLNVVTGTLQNHAMRVEHENDEAEVYAWDRVRDLALLRVTNSSPNAQQIAEIKPIAFRDAVKVLEPSEKVYLMGSSATGQLWSLKPGQLASVGPLASLAMVQKQVLQFAGHGPMEGGSATSPAESEALARHLLGPRGEVQVIEASAPCIPGDAGGPLVDSTGHLAGICSLAVQLPGDSATNYYYIHNSEVRDFLKDRPAAPLRLDLLDAPTAADYSDAKSFEFRSSGDSLALLGRDEDGDLAFVAVLNELDEISEPIRAQIAAGESIDVATVLQSTSPDFIWFSNYNARQFGAAYNRDGELGLDELRWDRNYDGQTDLLVLRSSPDRIPDPTGEETLIPMGEKISIGDASERQSVTALVEGAMKNLMQLSER